MAKLTKNNYFSKRNKCITNSKVGDFLRSKEIYKKKHIQHTYEFNKTPSMQLGSMVDEYISTGKPSSILKKYSVKVYKKDDPALYELQQTMDPQYVVSQEAYDRAIKMGEKIVHSNICYWLKFHKAKYQVPLQAEYSGVPVAGLLDALAIIGDTAYIVDFKTANSMAMKSDKSWYWACKDRGYIRQISHYSELVRRNYPEVKEISCFHVLISSCEEDNFPVKIYKLDPVSLKFEDELEVFKRTAVNISREQDWIDPMPLFNDPVLLQAPYYDSQEFPEESSSEELPLP